MDNILMDMIIFIENNKVVDGLYIAWICKSGWCYILHDTYLKHPKKYNKIQKQMLKMDKAMATYYFQVVEGKVII